MYLKHWENALIIPGFKQNCLTDAFYETLREESGWVDCFFAPSHSSFPLPFALGCTFGLLQEENSVCPISRIMRKLDVKRHSLVVMHLKLEKLHLLTTDKSKVLITRQENRPKKAIIPIRVLNLWNLNFVCFEVMISVSWQTGRLIDNQAKLR